jgi:mono/diheme cytochrome c family protein
LLALPASAAAAAPNPAGRGAELFRTHCAVCHGDNGEGIAGPPLRPLPIAPADIKFTVRDGRGQMPPFAPGDLPDADLTALIGFLETWR